MPGIPLACEVVVFRAATKRKHVDGPRFAPAAFLRRPQDAGLSVNYDCDPEECGKNFNPRYGVASLHVGRIRDIGLTVEGDDPGPPPHAEILGVPPNLPETEREAERLAGLLSEQSRTVFEREDRRQ
jgi:hypothetical protein